MRKKIQQELVKKREEMWYRMVARAHAVSFSSGSTASFTIYVCTKSKKEEFIKSPRKWFRAYRKDLHRIADMKADELERMAERPAGTNG